MAYAGKNYSFKAWLKEQKEGLKMETAVDYEKVYKADRKRFGTRVVVLEPGHLRLSQRNLVHLYRHSPDGFEWGYGGSGPADLALSILVDAVGTDLAEEHYQAFKGAFLATHSRDGFEIKLSEILGFIYGNGGEQLCQEAK
jgi:hypothetical protein